MSGEQVADAFAKLAQVRTRAGIDECAINMEYVSGRRQAAARRPDPDHHLLAAKTEGSNVSGGPGQVIDVEPQ